MLKNIPPILSPELLKILCEMGHGDKIVIADGNFPSESVGKSGAVVRCDGHGVPELLEAVLTLFPLDAYAEKPATLMAVVPGDPVETPIWEKYYGILEKAGWRGKDAVRHIGRFEFYAEAKEAYAVVATGEKALYANIMLQKGVVC
ncbi:MAG: fucose isomerase [Firmicutes bacterium]|nr:fucose isomerase [Bacillota bacterium]